MDYAVGDKVRILPEPPSEELSRDIWVCWVAEMDFYCGMEATIQSVNSDYNDRTYYHLDIDDGQFAWCSECFTDVTPAVDPELDDAEFFALLTV